MKRFLALLLVSLLIVVTATGCNNGKNPAPSSSSSSSSDVSSDTIETPSEEPSSEEPSSDESQPDTSVDETSSEQEQVLTGAQKRAKDIGEGTDATLLNASLSHEFDLSGNFKSQNAIRVANAIRKAQRGETVTIGFIGGQITANQDVEPVDTSYISLVRDWWQSNFPGQVNIINAGLYTMPSSIAVYRVRHDLLQYNPDLVFVDFAVQDALGGAASANKTPFESIIRRILESSKTPGIVMLLLGAAENNSFTMKRNNCDPITTAAKYETQVADWYGIPVIDFNNAVWENIFTLVDKKAYGEVPLLTWDTFGQENNIGLNSVGHLTLANMITTYLKLVQSKLGSIATSAPALPSGTRFGTKTMGADMITPNQLLNTSVTGYSIAESADDLRSYAYTIRNDASFPAGQSIIGYRPSKTVNDVTVGAYMTINVPEVTSSKVYMLLANSANVKADATVGTWHEYSPLQLEFYKSDGSLISNSKPGVGNLTDAINSYRVSAVSIPAGTTRIVYKVYVTGGVISFLGLGLDVAPAGITG